MKLEDLLRDVEAQLIEIREEWEDLTSDLGVGAFPVKRGDRVL